MYTNKLKRGEKHPHAKLTNNQAAEILRLYQETDASLRDLARQFRVSHMTINSIVQGRTWKNLPADHPTSQPATASHPLDTRMLPEPPTPVAHPKQKESIRVVPAVSSYDPDE